MKRSDNQQGRLKIKNINPWYITGFVEGEGTFHVALSPDPRMKFGWKIIPEFHVNQSYLRKDILEEIRKYFGCGYIQKNHAKNKNDTTFVYVVRQREDLNDKIIPFFERYPLRSKKYKNVQIFRKIVNLLIENQHSKFRGIKKIIAFAFQMNEKGKYRKLKQEDVLNSLKPSETIR